MTEKERLEAFEQMLAAVEKSYDQAEEKMQQLKAQGREKSATFRQMMGNKVMYANMLSLYRIYGLVE